MPQKLIVTGGLGFIGSQYIRLLLDENPEIRIFNFDCQTYAGNPENLAKYENNSRYHIEVLDIREPDKVQEAFQRIQPNSVVHFAAESHVDRSLENPKIFIETNVLGTVHLLEASLNHFQSLTAENQEHFRFVHVSTDEVYGSLGATSSFEETTAYDPSSPYSASKASSDHFVRAWHRTFGLPTLVANCSNNYGPFQFPEKLIPLMIDNAMHGKALPVYGNGKHVRDWLFVEDHARALEVVRQRGRIGETYNIGGEAERQNLEVVYAICDILDELLGLLENGKTRRGLITFVADRPGHDYRYAMNISKIKSELGWFPKYDFEGGLRKTIQWYLDNQAWLVNVTSGAYRDSGKRRYGGPNA